MGWGAGFWVMGEAAGADDPALTGVEAGEGLLAGDKREDDGIEEAEEGETETLGKEASGAGWLSSWLRAPQPVASSRTTAPAIADCFSL